MKVSMLMPIYHKTNPKHLDLAIYSIMNQTRKIDEFVIVCDGPISDMCEKVLKKYKNDLTVYRLAKNQGTGYALRYGVTKCKYEYIARHDSDDIANEDRIEKQLKYLKQHKDVDILGGQIIELYNNKVFGVRRVPLEDKDIKKYMKKRCPFNHQTVIMKKKSVMSVGNYPVYRNAQDYSLWINSYQLKMANLSDILTRVRVDDDAYKRRGNKKSIKYMIEMEKNMLDKGIINKIEYYRNILIRCIVIILPNFIRKWLYYNWLRENK